MLKWDVIFLEIPLDRLLIETDSPYMAPTPHRGKRNDPSLVQFVADTIAVEKGISYEKVCEATKENAKKFFGIKLIKFSKRHAKYSNILYAFFVYIYNK